MRSNMRRPVNRERGEVAAPKVDGRLRFGGNGMNAMRKAVLRCTRPIHHNLRDKKLDFFFELMQGELCGSLLDVGGGFGLNSEFVRLHHAFSDVIIVNVAPPPKWSTVPRTQKPELILGDGCSLPLRSGSVDWVFSNAV